MTPAITMMGCRIDNLSMEKNPRPGRGIHPRRFNACALVNVDGMPVVWAARLLAKPLKERVAGVDLFEALIVAIGSPRKEQFLGRWQASMRIPFAMGVGGSFDVAAGRVQRAGLEWFYRFLQDPRRMFHRYFIEHMAFIRRLVKEAAQRRKQ